MELNRGKITILVVLLAGSAYYGISKYRSLQPNPSVNNGVTGDFRRPDHHREITPDRRKQFETSLGITPEQQKQLEALRGSGRPGGPGGGRENWRERMTSMSAILTPQQREKMRQMREQRMDKTLQKALSPADMQKYKEKREQLRQQRGGRNRPR